ncbi:MAG: TlpA family protein disulfide reductase [Halopenitus sp.]
MDDRTRRAVLSGIGASTLGLAGCASGGSGGSDGGSSDGGSDSDSGGATDWWTATLTDVTTGDEFKISELEGPVLAHPFAIWCSTCKSQNEQIDKLQEQADYAVVQLNIGDGETGDDVRNYAEENGYAEHSKFVVAPNSVTESLVDEFGASAVSPPQSPVILLCPDGGTYTIDKVTAAAELQTTIESNCG